VRVSAVALVALALAAAGCAHEVPALKAKAKQVTPAGSRNAGDCASSEAVIESAWVKCIVVVRGTRRSAIAFVSRRLRKQGFRLGCRDELGTLELVGVHGHTRVIADARPGAITFDPADGGKPLDVVDARFVSGPSRRIPAGAVGLKIAVDKLESRAGSYLLPPGDCPS
jgi:hypothetical protein